LSLLHVNFDSEALGRSVRMDVILPDGIFENDAPVKTLYLLHGMTDDHTIWQRRTSIERYADERNIAVVMPGTKLGWYANAAMGENFYDYIGDELVRVSRALFPCLSHRREDTFIAGLSMGGYGAMKCALGHPELFAKAASFSGALDIYGITQLEEPLGPEHYWIDLFGPLEKIYGSENDLFAAAEKLKEERPKLFMWCGTEDFLYDMNVKMRDHLLALGYDLAYSEGPGDHQWKYWDREIRNALDWMLGEVAE